MTSKQTKATPEYKEKNRIYQNAWYHANKTSALATRKQRLEKMLQTYREYKSSRGCERCSETHFACIEFHHEDASLKEMNPAELIRKKGWTWERVKAELDGLMCLCSNCHRKEHVRLRALGKEVDEIL